MSTNATTPDTGELAGLTADQLATLTGFGRRNIEGCANTDTVLAKFLAGALTATGVMAVVFGHDSAEHHAGRVLS